MDEGEEVLLITVGRYTVLTKIVPRTKYGARANHLRSVFSGFYSLFLWLWLRRTP